MKNKRIYGLGGWLIIPIIDFFLSGALFLYDLIFSFFEVANYGEYMVMAIFGDLILLTLIAGSLTLIFRKSRYAPRFVILTYLAILLVDFIFFYFELYSIIIIIFSVIWVIIWIWYFSVSRRV